MQKYETSNIRNISLFGHSSHGKTTLAEAMLFLSKKTARMGNISDGNTVLDYDKEEIKRGLSISLAAAPVYWHDVKINVIDTPGYLDFNAEVAQAVRVTDSAIICVDAKAGIEVGCELAWDTVNDAKIPRAFFINKFDDPDARFAKVFKSLRDRFGLSVCPVLIPMVDGDTVTGFLDLIDMRQYVFDKEGGRINLDIPEAFADVAKEYRNMLYESIAETSEQLMNKFFAGEEITKEEAVNAIRSGFIKGDIAPVICGAASKTWGVEPLLEHIVDYFPSPLYFPMKKVLDGDKKIFVELKGEKPTTLFVFKTVSDPFVGKMSYFRVMTGELKKDMMLRNLTSGSDEKFVHIYTICGKEMTEVDELATGDIGVTTKMSNVNTNDTLVLDPKMLPYVGIPFEEPYTTVAIKPAAKGDEDKISQAISKILEEDKTVRFKNNAQTKQLVLSAIGDIHLDVISSKLKNRYGITIEMTDPKIAYRETIKKSSDAEGKYKKQSGGHGQYGHVKIRFSPCDSEGLEFTESCVGGSVPKNFHPAVQKGLEDSMQHGILAGYPCVGVKADLYDGSYHDVDSSEMSFKLAANIAYKEGMKKASPVILEPVGLLYVSIPDNFVGDVMGTVNKRRGRVLGVLPEEKKPGFQCVEAEVPMAEMRDYTTTLRAITQGRGSHKFHFVRYEEAPAAVVDKIIANSDNKTED